MGRLTHGSVWEIGKTYPMTLMEYSCFERWIIFLDASFIKIRVVDKASWSWRWATHISLSARSLFFLCRVFWNVVPSGRLTFHCARSVSAVKHFRWFLFCACAPLWSLQFCSRLAHWGFLFTNFFLQVFHWSCRLDLFLLARFTIPSNVHAQSAVSSSLRWN